MQRIKFIGDNDKKEIIIPSSKNWFFIIIFFVAILVWLVVELIIVPTLIIANLNHFLSFAPWLVGWTAIGLFIIKIWVWEAFGKTILLIRENELVIKKKFDFISSTKYFKLIGITDLSILNKDIETTRYFTRPNYLFSSKTKSIILNYGFLKVNVVDWLNQEEAEQIIAVLSKSIESSKSQEN
ncbi:hypothetical protein [Pedobacter soli]|uniref:Uncharacterized protein n=1 Tax=Pedobacter soli TaxID=390242 RepID=A0A1G6IHH9_9SPHI|nr:hypothetical protein [Pedobacter soli]SDC06022.1 hypothetical protein SAMN04488024_101158 [Pedobacter soli]